MQYREVEAPTFSLAQTASVDIQLTKVKALLRDIQASGHENGSKLEGIFRTCLLALQQLEERATSLSTELRHRGGFRGGDLSGALPQATSGGVCVDEKKRFGRAGGCGWEGGEDRL
jgi:hypothetical protein